MTSTDFAARYRLLKNVATRGARSFLAQQTALGRMVMVHYLDSETPEQRSATLARLDTLKPPAREKLLEIADVDGSPVAVTLFISSFVDFATWLDHVSAPPPVAAPSPASAKAAPSTPGDFTRAFTRMETPAAPPVMAPKIEPAPQRQAPPPPMAKQAGDFTRFFGKVDAAELRPAPTARAEPTPPAPRPADFDSPTLIMEAPKAAPRPAPSETPPAPASTEGGSGFTAIFGRIGETRLPDDLPAETPKPAAPTPGAGRVMQPAPVPDFHQSTGPLPPPPSIPPAQSGGEFTQLFQRLSATPPSASPVSLPASSAPAMMPPPSFGLPSEPPRPIDEPPRADLMPPPSRGAPLVLPAPSLGAPTLPTPSLGSSLPAPALGIAPPSASPIEPRLPDVKGLPNVPSSAPNVAAAPPSPWGAAPLPASAGLFGAGAAESEYTRILGRVALPPPPPIIIQPPAAVSAAAPGRKATNSMLPLIIALSVVLMMTLAIVAYFVFRK